jgi:hypothetical protein
MNRAPGASFRADTVAPIVWVDAMSFSPRGLDVEAEYSSADFGDARLSARVVSIAEALSAERGASLPQSFLDRSPLAAAYRFFSHDRVTLARILDPHFTRTAARVVEAGVVLALHDTTKFEFDGEREGLGRLSSATSRGFLLHGALAVSADGVRRPLGVLAARTWVRPKKKRARPKGKRLNGPALAKLKDRESSRWRETMEQAEERVALPGALIHVGDRETDAFPLLAYLADDTSVLRAAHDRRIENEDFERLSEVCVFTRDVLELEVPIGPSAARKHPAAAKRFAPRTHRVAKLAVSAMQVELKAPEHLQSMENVVVHLVHAHEIDVPEGDALVHWLLYTSEPVSTEVEILTVLEHYRTRWLIEEFFKALKTGCHIEKLQLETYGALVNALAVYLPIASDILALRTTARAPPDTPATSVLSVTQLEVLRLFSPMKLGPSPTVRQAFIAVANLGGYRVHKIPPGWQTLARGMDKLLHYEVAYRAGKGGRDLRDR